MGDPRRLKKKYSKPSHPWQLDRMQEEAVLVKEYGFKNKRELWKMKSILKKAADEAKRLIIATGPQAAKEEKQLIQRLHKYGMVPGTATIDNVLGLTIRDILERRLQTQVYKKGLAHSVQQSRQFITHNHIHVSGRTINAPSYLVLQAEESMITFDPGSTLSNSEHPERQMPEKKPGKAAKGPAGHGMERGGRYGRKKDRYGRHEGKGIKRGP